MTTQIVYIGDKETVIVANPKPKRLFQKNIPVTVSDTEAKAYLDLPYFSAYGHKPKKSSKNLEDEPNEEDD